MVKKPEESPKVLSEKISLLQEQLNQLQQRSSEAEEALNAIHRGAVDALVTYSDEGVKIFTIQGAETTYRLMIESINEGAATLIEDGTILYCNRRFAEMIDIPLEEIIGTSMHQYISSKNQEVFSSLLLQGLKENCRAEMELQCKDGSLMPVMVSLNTFSAGDNPAICLVATDLTDRKLAAEMAALVQLRILAEEELSQAHEILQKVNADLVNEINEHKQTEISLMESRRRFQDIIETTGEFIWEMDDQGRYTYCSPQMETLWGLKPADMLGKTPFDVMPPDVRDKLLVEFINLVGTGSPFRDVTATSYNGYRNLIYIETSGNPFFDQDGKLLGFRGITRDITERRLAEEKLQKAYDEMEQRVQERTRELSLLNEELKAEVSVRERAEKNALSSAQLAEGLAQSIIALNSSLDLEHVLDAILEQLRRSVPYSIAALTQLDDRKVHLIRCTSTNDPAEADRVTKFKVLIMDYWRQKNISDKKQPVYIPDLSKYPDWNEILGEDSVGCYLAAPLVVGGQFQGTIHLLSNDPESFNTEMVSRLVAFSGPAAAAIQNALLYKDLQSALHHEQTMRQQLVQTEKLSALNRMMATVIHEINNPVQTIKNCVYLAKQDTPPASSNTELLNMASSEIDRISKLVASLREIYRQPKTVVVEALSVAKILGDVHMLLEPHLQNQKIAWRQEPIDDKLLVYATADHLKQVFLNISMNAIEAMQPEGGIITISSTIEAENNEIAIAIEDTGPGIGPEILGQIFEPFYTTKEEGSGLGLAICYEIVQRHSGRITVDSELGKGSIFKVWLPLAEPLST